MFDADAFVERTLSQKQKAPKYQQQKNIDLPCTPLYYPSYKVPQNNLQKLAYDRRIVHISIDIKIPRQKIQVIQDSSLKQINDKNFDYFIMRDSFDWDLSDHHVRPKIFSKKFVESLQKAGIFCECGLSEQLMKELSESIELQILDQIWGHVQKNTNLPVYARLPKSTLKIEGTEKSDLELVPVLHNVQNSINQSQIGNSLFQPLPIQNANTILRLTRKEEELVTVWNTCINCGSIMKLADYCKNCCYYYDRKPGAISAMLSVNGPYGVGTGIQHDKQIPLPAAKSNLSNPNQPQAHITEQNSNMFPLLHQMPPEKLINIGILDVNKENNQQENKEENLLNNENSIQKESRQITELNQWKKRALILSKLYNPVQKDRKVCKKCQHQNPFFRQDCEKCDFKYGCKQRNERNSISQSINQSAQYTRSSDNNQQINLFGQQGFQINIDNYSVLFWEMLCQNIKSQRLISNSNSKFNQSDIIFLNCEYFDSSFTQLISEQLTEFDFSSVRDLYKRIKEILTQEDAEKIFGLLDTDQLLEVHDYIDKMFEIFVTDNQISQQVFKEAMNKKKSLCSVFSKSSNLIDNQQSNLKGYNKDLISEIEQNTHSDNIILNASNIIKEKKQLYQAQLQKKRFQKLQGKNQTRFIENLFEELQPYDQSLLLNQDYNDTIEHPLKPFNFDNNQILQLLDNYFLLNRIGYLDQEVLESQNIQNLISYYNSMFMKKDIFGKGVHQQQGIQGYDIHGYDGFNSHNRRGRGRPKRVEIMYEDLRDLNRISDKVLIFPPNHGMTFQQLLALEFIDQDNSYIEQKVFEVEEKTKNQKNNQVNQEKKERNQINKSQIAGNNTGSKQNGKKKEEVLDTESKIDSGLSEQIQNTKITEQKDLNVSGSKIQNEQSSKQNGRTRGIRVQYPQE